MTAKSGREWPNVLFLYQDDFEPTPDVVDIVRQAFPGLRLRETAMKDIEASHSVGVSPLKNARRMELFCENLRAFVEGKPLKNAVDRQWRY